MTNNKQQTNPENPNNQFSNSEPMTFTQKVEYVKSIDMTNNKQQTEINAVEYLDKVNQFAKENNTGKQKQQTAIEWLEQEMLKPNLSMKEILEQAKEMEKEQHRVTAEDFYYGNWEYKKFHDYYNETYEGGEQ